MPVAAHAFTVGRVFGKMSPRGIRRTTGHRSCSQVPSERRNRLDMQLVVAKIILCVIQDLACSFGALKSRACVARHNRGVIHEVHKSTSMLGQDDLLLGAFDSSSKMVVICLLELLACL